MTIAQKEELCLGFQTLTFVEGQSLKWIHPSGADEKMVRLESEEQTKKLEMQFIMFHYLYFKSTQ